MQQIQRNEPDLEPLGTPRQRAILLALAKGDPLQRKESVHATRRPTTQHYGALNSLAASMEIFPQGNTYEIADLVLAAWMRRRFEHPLQPEG